MSLSLLFATAYIQSKVQTLVRFLTDTAGGEAEKMLAQLVDVSHLKSKFRDEIEKAILSWSEGVNTGMEGWRETRMRNYYGDRCRLAPLIMSCTRLLCLCKSRIPNALHARSGGMILQKKC